MTSSQYRIREFDPTAVKPDSIILIVGPRHSGKSVFLENLLYHMRNKFNYGVGRSPTTSTQEMFKKHMPASCVYDNADSAHLAQMLKVTNELVAMGKVRHTLVVYDDLIYNKSALKGEAIRKLFMNGRHHRACFMNLMQYVMDMDVSLRSNIDYIMVFKQDNVDNIKRFYTQFFGVFPDERVFGEVLANCTENYMCLVCDNTKRTSVVEDKIFWYKAPLDNPPFKMFDDVFHRLDARYSIAAEDPRDRMMRLRKAFGTVASPAPAPTPPLVTRVGSRGQDDRPGSDSEDQGDGGGGWD